MAPCRPPGPAPQAGEGRVGAMPLGGWQIRNDGPPQQGENRPGRVLAGSAQGSSSSTLSITSAMSSSSSPSSEASSISSSSSSSASSSATSASSSSSSAGSTSAV